MKEEVNKINLYIPREKQPIFIGQGVKISFNSSKNFNNFQCDLVDVTMLKEGGILIINQVNNGQDIKFNSLTFDRIGIVHNNSNKSLKIEKIIVNKNNINHEVEGNKYSNILEIRCNNNLLEIKAINYDNFPCMEIVALGDNDSYKLENY